MDNKLDASSDLVDTTADDDFPAIETTPEELLGELADTMPPITEADPDAAPSAEPEMQEDSPDNPGQFGGIKDSAGQTFDPTKHQTGPDGKPLYYMSGKKSGQFRRKKGVPDPSGKPIGSSSSDNYDALARTYFEGGTGLMTGIFGEEWQPDDAEEAKGMVAVIAASLRFRKAEAANPDLMLGIAATGYSVKRFFRPTTRTRLVALAAVARDSIKSAYSSVKSFLGK